MDNNTVTLVYHVCFWVCCGALIWAWWPRRSNKK